MLERASLTKQQRALRVTGRSDQELLRARRRTAQGQAFDNLTRKVVEQERDRWWRVLVQLAERHTLVRGLEERRVPRDRRVENPGRGLALESTLKHAERRVVARLQHVQHDPEQNRAFRVG